MINTQLICSDCKHARKSHGLIVACTTIGIPELAFRYGKCRRFQAKRPPETNIFDIAQTYCETCENFVAGDHETPDQCLNEIGIEDAQTDADGVVIKCKYYQPLKDL